MDRGAGAAGRPDGSRALRVLVLDHTARHSGAELALVRLCEALDDSVDVRCVLFEDGPLVRALRERGVATAVLPLDPAVVARPRDAAVRPTAGLVGAVVRVLRFERELFRLVRRTAPDVVHSTSLKADLLALAPARLARRPLVWHVHDRIADDYLPPLLTRLVRLASRLPRAVVANSRATAATLPVPAVVAYPGLAPGQVRDGPRAPTSGPPVVGMVGRIGPTKGQRELVRAAPQVLRAHPQARFRVVGAATFGEHRYESDVRREADELGVAPRFTWTGAVGDPTAELDGMSVLVHASPVPEPFGQVVVEALARGVPVVATDAGGVPEILGRGPGALGTLVPPGDVAALAAAVVAVLDDPGAAHARAEHARAVVADRFAVARTARLVTEVWRRAARSGRRRRP